MFSYIRQVPSKSVTELLSDTTAFVAKYVQKLGKVAIRDFKAAPSAYYGTFMLLIFLIFAGVKVVSLTTGATMWIATIVFYMFTVSIMFGLLRGICAAFKD